MTWRVTRQPVEVEPSFYPGQDIGRRSGKLAPGFESGVESPPYRSRERPVALGRHPEGCRQCLVPEPLAQRAGRGRSRWTRQGNSGRNPPVSGQWPAIPIGQLAETGMGGGQRTAFHSPTRSIFPSPPRLVEGQSDLGAWTSEEELSCSQPRKTGELSAYLARRGSSGPTRHGNLRESRRVEPRGNRGSRPGPSRVRDRSRPRKPRDWPQSPVRPGPGVGCPDPELPWPSRARPFGRPGGRALPAPRPLRGTPGFLRPKIANDRRPTQLRRPFAGARP